MCEMYEKSFVSQNGVAGATVHHDCIHSTFHSSKTIIIKLMNNNKIFRDGIFNDLILRHMRNEKKNYSFIRIKLNPKPNTDKQS